MRCRVGAVFTAMGDADHNTAAGCGKEEGGGRAIDE